LRASSWKRVLHCGRWYSRVSSESQPYVSRVQQRTAHLPRPPRKRKDRCGCNSQACSALPAVTFNPTPITWINGKKVAGSARHDSETHNN
jgi:hypothetical protein